MVYRSSYDEYASTFGVITIVLFLVVIGTLARINRNFEMVPFILSASSKKNWSIYGGRDDIKEHIESNPIHFSIYGLVVSPALVIGAVSAVASTVVAAVTAKYGLA